MREEQSGAGWRRAGVGWGVGGACSACALAGSTLMPGKEGVWAGVMWVDKRPVCKEAARARHARVQEYECVCTCMWG